MKAFWRMLRYTLMHAEPPLAELWLKASKKKKAVEMLILNVLVKDKSTPENLASSQQNKHINRELVRSD